MTSKESPTRAGSEPLPLATLLSQTLISLNDDFTRERAGHDSLPSLAVWANVLQYIAGESVTMGDLPRHACLSRRAIRTALGRLDRKGFVTVDADKRVRLTTRGRRAYEDWRTLMADVEERLEARFGQVLRTLRVSLERLVRRCELELPHYPTSYGTADPTMTGGPGRDWTPVRRADADTVTGLPLAALLSQALAAMTMEYERRNGPLPWSANALRVVGPEGLSVTAKAAPSPKSGLVRHGFLSVDDDPSDGRTRRIRLTAMGRQIYQRHLPTLGTIEQEWRARFGEDVVTELRASLEALVGTFPADLPHHPPVHILWFDGRDPNGV